MKNTPTLNWKGDEYYRRHPSRKKLRDSCIERVDWTALRQYASSKHSSHPCSLLDESTLGGIHLIRLLDFGDTQWIARVQLEPSTQESASILQAEIHAMELIRARSAIPMPEIFGYELNDNNSVGAAFVLMEFLPGSSAMDAAGGYEVHHGQIPLERRSGFYEEMARIQVQLSSIRLPKIGTVIKRAGGSFDAGPIPGLGGPFSSASAFFKAWADQAKFPMSENTIRKLMNGTGLVEEVVGSIRKFPSRLREVAPNISDKNNNGPFPLYHSDLYHSNVIVDGSFGVLGVIDWEGACTVPWEIVEPPLFLSVVPPAMDDPNNYDADGQPKDGDTKRRLNERAEYADYVRRSEAELKTDRKLSETLLDSDIQALAHAMKLYLDPGKLGLYCNVLDPFRCRS